MVRLLVPDLVVLGRTPRFWPPSRRLLVAAGVRVCGLLLGLHGLDPGLGNELTRCLLAVFEPLFIEAPNSVGVADPDASTRRDRHGNIVFVIDGSGSPDALAPLADRTTTPVTKSRVAAAAVNHPTTVEGSRAVVEAVLKTVVVQHGVRTFYDYINNPSRGGPRESLTCIDARHDLSVSVGIKELADGVVRHPTSRAGTEKGHGRAIFVNGSNKIVLGNNAAVGSQCLVDLLLFECCQKRLKAEHIICNLP